MGLADAGRAGGDAARVDAASADSGGIDLGMGELSPAWNDDTCQIEDDGASMGAGGLEVSSMVIAEDGDLSDRVDDGTTVYYPAILETSACRFALIGWGNGTSGRGGAHYPAYFERLASYGFVVAVAHTNAALDTSAPVLSSVELVRAESEDPSSVFFEKLESSFGLMGKSQGAIAIARDLAHPDAVAGVLIGSGSMPGASVTKPGLFATGDADFARAFVVRSYEAAAAEAIFVQAVQPPNPQAEPAAGHLDLDDRLGIVELSTSFMRCHLRGSAASCRYVRCEDCQTEPWRRFETKGAP